jgi:hypothetical protein
MQLIAERYGLTACMENQDECAKVIQYAAMLPPAEFAYVYRLIKFARSVSAYMYKLRPIIPIHSKSVKKARLNKYNVCYKLILVQILATLCNRINVRIALPYDT